MSFNFIVPGSFDISQNAELYVQEATGLATAQFHYTIDKSGTLGDLFTTKTYQENSVNNEEYDVSLVVDTAAVEAVLLATDSCVNQAAGTNGNFNGLLNEANFETRLLEMAAIKIFGHAKARAAIGNDKDFAGKETIVSTHMATELAKPEVASNFFETYVSLNRLEMNTDDITAPVVFNLADAEMYVFGNLGGDVLDATPGTAANASWNQSTPYAPSYTVNMRLHFNGKATQV